MDTARRYLELWDSGRFEAMRALVADPPTGFVQAHRDLAEELMVSDMQFALGRITEAGDRATARFTARLHLRGLGEWTYRGRLTLRPGEERWLVNWASSTMHPDLGRGHSLTRTRSWPERAPILAADGSSIAAQQQGVVVGLQPGRVRDAAEVAAILERNLGSDPRRVLEAFNRNRGRPDDFVPLEDISAQRYEQVRPAIYDVPGLVFQRRDLRLSVSGDLARPLVGRVGEATEEDLEELGEPYLPGDRVGRFGLEKAFEKQLAGRPSGQLRVVDSRGQTLRVLRTFDGEPGRPVKTTLDMGVQRAADAALDGVSKPAALVVLDSGSSEVRAVANRPVTGFNRAVAGRYAPGSTFKVVTAAALLGSGVGLDQSVECPPQTSAGGRTFRNFEGTDLGRIDFRTAFRESCNTAFANLVRSLDEARLATAAETFGFRSQYSLPVDTASPSFPPPADLTERVAAAIGQARVEASPLHMASVAAAVASGAWKPPSVTAREPGRTGASAETRQIDPAVAGALRELMRLVVERGTGQMARAPGRTVSGKTGTAEFGTARPPRTHAWFVGFSGPLAFAVLVEDGGVGGEVAAPLAAKFLLSLEPDDG